MRQADIITGCVLALLALLGLFWLIPTQTADVEGASMPPSLGPQLSLIAILLLCLALVVRSVFASKPGGEAPMGVAQWIHLAKLLGIVGVGVAVIRYGSFFLGSFFMMAALMIVICHRPPWRAALWAGGVAAAIQLPLYFVPLSELQ
ncbi:MAG: hypothetical protein ACREIP_12775 [Alphaproteobacteria bacterium]